MNKERLTSISSWDELQARKAELNNEIDTAGQEIANQTKEFLVKGARITAATVTSILVTKAVANYVKYRKLKDERDAKFNQTTTAPPLEQQESSTASSAGRAATFLMWMDTIIKIVQTGIELYNQYTIKHAQGHTSEEE